MQPNNDTKMRRDIIAAARLLFQTKGFEKTTLKDLLEKLQISEQVFSEYFQSMDDLLEVVWSES